ncbi:cytidylate kinase [Lachnospiraceae bacterium KM106-2]|nr:cytidylate kinase [Lachnospiraceae bacterium KM106-2]
MQYTKLLKEVENMAYSIAIDGPAGAGKSTIAKKVAKKIGFIYVDTGAMYRAMALYFIHNQITGESEEQISEACKHADITITYVNGEQQVLLNGENVTKYLRTEEVGKMASIGAKNKDVRVKLVELQRKLAEKEDVIMDGRDVGTQILPNANVKIYLTASSKVRAKRRWLELNDKGIECDIDEIEKDIIARDEQDMNREISPLRQAEDALLVDCSDMSIDEVVDKIIEVYNDHR